MGKVVKARNLNKEFGDGDILENVNLEVESNEIVAVMGPNGSGKTVLLCCLAAGLNPSKGEIEVFGNKPREVKEKFNLMVQDSSTVQNLTGRENIDFYSRLHPEWTSDWKELVEGFGIENELGKKVRKYSGGMRKKLELAITFSTDVPLYFLDEPSSELDLSMVRMMHDRILNEKEDGKTIVMSTHRPVDAEIADKIIFVSNGVVSEKGTSEELLESVPRVAKGNYSELKDEKESFVDGEIFETGSEAKGFLKDGIENREFDVSEPDYTDMFDYYTHVK